jgi:hypothetical protein
MPRIIDSAPTASEPVVSGGPTTEAPPRDPVSGLGATADLAAVGAWWIASIGVCWLTGVPWIVANVLVLGVPLAYLLHRSAGVRAALRWTFVGKYVAFVTVFFNYLCVRFGGWGGDSVLPTVAGVNVEQVSWTFLFIALAIACNEAFFVGPGARRTRRYPRTILTIMFFGGFVIALTPPLRELMSGHVYLKVGIGLYPIALLLALTVNVRVIPELVRIMVLFGALNLPFELLALEHDYWTFPGEYIGWVDIAGYRFPVEELVFLVLLCAPAVVATYSLYKNWKGLH